MEPSWAVLEASLAVLRPSWGYVGASWRHLGLSWRLWWLALGVLEAILGILDTLQSARHVFGRRLPRDEAVGAGDFRLNSFNPSSSDDKMRELMAELGFTGNFVSAQKETQRRRPRPIGTVCLKGSTTLYHNVSDQDSLGEQTYQATPGYFWGRFYQSDALPRNRSLEGGGSQRDRLVVGPGGPRKLWNNKRHRLFGREAWEGTRGILDVWTRLPTSRFWRLMGSMAIP